MSVLRRFMGAFVSQCTCRQPFKKHILLSSMQGVGAPRKVWLSGRVAHAHLFHPLPSLTATQPLPFSTGMGWGHHLFAGQLFHSPRTRHTAGLPPASDLRGHGHSLHQPTPQLNHYCLLGDICAFVRSALQTRAGQPVSVRHTMYYRLRPFRPAAIFEFLQGARKDFQMCLWFPQGSGQAISPQAVASMACLLASRNG